MAAHEGNIEILEIRIRFQGKAQRRKCEEEVAFLQSPLAVCGAKYRGSLGHQMAAEGGIRAVVAQMSGQCRIDILEGEEVLIYFART